MKLKVRYFGMIAEWAGANSETIAFDGSEVGSLTNQLETDLPKLKGISYQIVVNQEIASMETTLSEFDEVSLLPPFAGG